VEDEFQNEPLFDQDDEADEEVISRLRKLDQDRVNDARKEWQAMYGFDHECSCATDTEEGNTLTIPMCYAGAAAEAFDNLARVRSFLYAIATSPTKEASILRALAAEAFHGA
jgi:hypothetical protein